MDLVPCTRCHRHIARAADACPFCPDGAPSTLRVVTGRRVARLTRAAMFYLGATTAAACGAEPPPPEPETIAQPYGAPPDPRPEPPIEPEAEPEGPVAEEEADEPEGVADPGGEEEEEAAPALPPAQPGPSAAYGAPPSPP